LEFFNFILFSISELKIKIKNRGFSFSDEKNSEEFEVFYEKIAPRNIFLHNEGGRLKL